MNSLNVMGLHYIYENSSQNQLLNKIQRNTSHVTSTESLSLNVTYDNLTDDTIVNNNRKDSNNVLLMNHTIIQDHNITTVIPTDVSSQSVEANNSNNNNNDNYNSDTHSVTQTSQITTDKIEHRNDKMNKNLLKLQNKHKIMTNSSIKFMRYNTGDTIQLKCRIPKEQNYKKVLWNKLGLDYPLTIGKNRFIPDERFEIQHKPPNRWNLIISNAQLNDTGVYSCTTGSGISNSHSIENHKSDLEHYQEYQPQSVKNKHKIHTTVIDSTTTRKQNKGREYYVSVVEPLPSERYQIDVPVNKIGMKNKTITVTGPNLVFYGTPLELICRASFPSSEAKLDPTISLEWYHRGIRRLSHPFRSGGVYITMQWLDSHLLESRLFISWVSEAEAGQWICLERSNPMKNINYTKSLSSLSSLSMSNYRNYQMNEFNKQSFPSYHNLSVPYNNPSNIDLVYDKIYIEIIDIPDTTHSVQMTTQSTIFTEFHGYR
uniref:Ig-like domain-containing protein n=1 Tax=Schistosoma mansoni TaxID=6183 RepID=A0A3Q0KSM4_SCHMA